VLGYALTTGCRRAALAEHFGEHVGAAECNKMCDNCQSDTVVVKQDVTFYVQEILDIIDRKWVTFEGLNMSFAN
jgi:superfamily II DNA helicase RecQ